MSLSGYPISLILDSTVIRQQKKSFRFFVVTAVETLLYKQTWTGVVTSPLTVVDLEISIRDTYATV